MPIKIKSWDLRAKEPLVNCFNEQEDVINDFGIAGNTLLAASSDGTLGAYDFRRQKLLVRSEPMHNELLCLAVTHKLAFPVSILFFTRSSLIKFS